MTRPENAEHVGSVVRPAVVRARRRDLLQSQDAKLSRCTYCGDWRYGHATCDTCGTPEPAQAHGRAAS